MSQSTPISGPGGAIIRWFGTSIDIHEQQVLKTHLRDVEARLQVVVTHASLVMWATDIKGIITFAAGATFAKMGVDSRGMIGHVRLRTVCTQ